MVLIFIILDCGCSKCFKSYSHNFQDDKLWDFVDCDNCCLRYHINCVGLKSIPIPPEKFLCKKCKFYMDNLSQSDNEFNTEYL